MKYKCDRDCFNCILEDCIVETISPEEREEIRERDKRNDIIVGTRSIINSRRTRKKYIGIII